MALDSGLDACGVHSESNIVARMFEFGSKMYEIDGHGSSVRGFDTVCFHEALQLLSVQLRIRQSIQRRLVN